MKIARICTYDRKEDSLLMIMSDETLGKCSLRIPGKISAMLNFDSKDIFEEFKIRIMPNLDTAGEDVTGLTMVAGKNILSNLPGDDIGCGVTIAKLENFRHDFQNLDKFIKENLSNTNLSTNIFDLSQLCIFDYINLEKIFQDFGTLGAGDHFIDIDSTFSVQRFSTLRAD